MIGVERIGLPTSSVSIDQARGFAPQPGVLREGAAALLDLEHAQVHPLLRRDDRSAARSPRGCRTQLERSSPTPAAISTCQTRAPDPDLVDFGLSAELTADQRSAFDESRSARPRRSCRTAGLREDRRRLCGHRPAGRAYPRDRGSQPLVEQWRERLLKHLGLDRQADRTARGGPAVRRRESSTSRWRSPWPAVRTYPRLGARYGLVVVDECHHVPAVTFERCVRQLPVRRWLGLTATPYRRDGLQASDHHVLRSDTPRISGPGIKTTSTARLELVVHGTGHADARKPMASRHPEDLPRPGRG